MGGYSSHHLTIQRAILPVLMNHHLHHEPALGAWSVQKRTHATFNPARCVPNHLAIALTDVTSVHDLPYDWVNTHRRHPPSPRVHPRALPLRKRTGRWAHHPAS